METSEIKSLKKYGESLVGKEAQSTVLTEISPCGQKKVMSQPSKITGYSIEDWCGEPALMVQIDGVDVFESTLINISK